MAEAQPAVPDAFEWRQSPAGRILVSRALAAIADHCFSSRDAVPAGSTMPDYGALGGVFGLDEPRIVRVRQVHGREVFVRRPGDLSGGPIDADVVVSTDGNCAISVRVADCVPILMADRRRRAVAAVHAGWRGTAAAAAQAAVDALRREGVRPEDLVAAIGPSIGPCCYQVDTAVRDAFSDHGAAADAWFTSDGPDRWRLDLPRANRAQLEACGVPASQIAAVELCTTHDPGVWCSHRRQGAAAGRMVAAIRLYVAV